ncbi:adenylyltransferase/sulfurtransferase MoeZ [Georgenia yuyongxinii]|uniref:Adenylyltransferase/sulfurtransferase MoeZ n=1 Tax=Georgenia yuyongxinii TaxID=2589797 RepID=A0A5B8C1X4_9MICO|nr:ThiF family adenylyltransferase [Georgenia yuyongxinii]QDC23511.1 adenylyltransferase/sulfurtransferase MoeZ [Georgenia yuyongxinii]
MPLPPLVDPGPPLTREQVQLYSRHLLLGQLGEDGQRRLRAARVLVMGAGGLGAPALLYLAAAGVGQVGIVDDDVVDASNLQRQVIHTLADVGRPKVDSAAEKMHALNPEVEVTRHHLRLDAANARDIFAAYDLVLDGTDNFPTRYLVNDVCAELGLPLVWGSILRFDAQVSVFWSRPRPAAGRAAAADASDLPPAVTLRDLFPSPPPAGTTPSCGQAGVLGAMCGQVGSVMATEAVKLITGTGEPLLGRVLVLDALSSRWSELPVRPRTGARPPATVAELGYDPTGSPAGSAGAACLVSDVAAPAPALAEPPAISAAELAERLTARERGADDFVLLDVREPAERSIVAIPGAVGIPLGKVLTDPEAAVHRLGLARPGGVARELLVHCRSGQRSADAVRALRDAGARAVNVDGGVLAWVEDVDPTLPTY